MRISTPNWSNADAEKARLSVGSKCKSAGSNQTIGDGESVEKSAAQRADIEARRLREPELILQEERRAREVRLGRESGQKDAVEVVGRLSEGNCSVTTLVYGIH